MLLAGMVMAQPKWGTNGNVSVFSNCIGFVSGKRVEKLENEVTVGEEEVRK